ncbi:hypothetical protein [Haloferax sp. ATB1]|uniref:hypothetical protein n=1 Tax=Haloferax sp. ATB1 TaxID=1508454 RepID=UPI0005B22AA6|nr:hypothetical protein [Haloferax sp. ATB1]
MKSSRAQPRTDHLTDTILREAAPEAKAEIRQQNLEKLTDDQQAVYEIIREHDGVRPDALYEAYCERVVEPQTRRTMTNHLQKMRRYNLVEAEGRGTARAYRAV